MSDRLIVVSTDCHAGLHIADYKPYVESRYHDMMDMAVPVQLEMMEKASKSFLIQEINEAWRAPIQQQLTGAWDYQERLKMLAGDGIAAEVLFPDGVRVACHHHPAGTAGGVLVTTEDVAGRRTAEEIAARTSGITSPASPPAASPVPPTPVGTVPPTEPVPPAEPVP